MFKSISMSSLVSVAVLTALFACSAQAKDPQGPQDPKDLESQTTLALSAELSVAHTSIGSLLSQIEEQAEGVSRHPDYERRRVQWLESVRKGALAFENALKGDQSLFVSLPPLVASYRQLKSSTQFSDAQRVELLKSRRAMIESHLESLSAEYAKLLVRLIESPGLSLDQARARELRQFNKSDEVFKNLLVSEDGPVVFNFLSPGCLTRACIAQAALDQVTFIYLAMSLYAKDLSFKLDPEDPTSVVSIRSPKAVELHAERMTEALMRTDTFGDGYWQLPSNLDADVFAKEGRDQARVDMMAARRAYYLKRMAKHINDRRHGSWGRNYRLSRLDGYFRALCEAPLRFPQLKERVEGCITDIEINVLGHAWMLNHPYDAYISLSKHARKIARSYDRRY